MRNILDFMNYLPIPSFPLQIFKRKDTPNPNRNAAPSFPPPTPCYPSPTHPTQKTAHDDQYIKYHQCSFSPNTSISCRTPSCSPSTSSPHPHWQVTPHSGPPTLMLHISEQPQLLELDSLFQIFLLRIQGPRPAGAEWRCRPLCLGKLSGRVLLGGTSRSWMSFLVVGREVIQEFDEGLVESSLKGVDSGPGNRSSSWRVHLQPNPRTWTSWPRILSH